MRRAWLFALIGAGVIVFLVISALLARVFSVDDAERSAITSLVQTEAKGDAAGMIRQLYECSGSAACRARARTDAQQLRRAGGVLILQLDTSAGFSLTSTLGTARVAWRAGSALPVTQCVKVRRAGNALSGLHVELLEISLRQPTDSSCPPTY
jgi:hypothetical protein